MPIKEQLLWLSAEMDKPINQRNKMQLVAKLLQLVADMQDEKIQVTADDFSALSMELQKVALLCLASMTIATIQ